MNEYVYCALNTRVKSVTMSCVLVLLVLGTQRADAADQTQSIAGAASPGDILGVRLGMSQSEVRAALLKFRPELTQKEAPEGKWDAVQLEATLPPPPSQQGATSERIIVKFTKTNPKVWFVGRSVAYPAAERPLTKAIMTDVLAKFGKPTVAFGGGTLYWGYNESGRQESGTLTACKPRQNTGTIWSTYGGPSFQVPTLNSACRRLVLVDVRHALGDTSKEIALALVMYMVDPGMALADPSHPANVANDVKQRMIDQASTNKPKL